jgi:hypothetical protein
MPADPVYVALQLFHQWSQVAAVCALLLALASFAMLAVSRRLAPSRAVSRLAGGWASESLACACWWLLLENARVARRLI